MHEQILAFWFEEIDPGMWWAAEPAFDALLRERFQSTLESAARGELFSWRASPRGRLAEVIVLDQFSRNIYRNTVRAFAQDPMALALSREAVSLGALEGLKPAERAFLLMPWMHSESSRIHVEAARLFREWAPEKATGSNCATRPSSTASAAIPTGTKSSAANRVPRKSSS